MHFIMSICPPRAVLKPVRSALLADKTGWIRNVMSKKGLAENKQPPCDVAGPRRNVQGKRQSEVKPRRKGAPYNSLAGP